MNKPFIICIIDDDEVYQYTITRAIQSQKLGKKILIFSDGEEAIEFMNDNIGNKEDLPDVVFLDINMPIMDGWQFLEEYVKIKPRIGKKITIYMVSSSVHAQDLKKAEKISEISDYIIKPIELQKLNEIILTLSEDNEV